MFTNILLKKDLSKEVHSIHPETNEIKLYRNLDEALGLTIYDTIGVEKSNANNNIGKIKLKLKKNLIQILKSLKIRCMVLYTI